MSPPTARIYLKGHPDDLYALSLLFPEGAYQGLHVVTQITGVKKGAHDWVENAENTETYVTGEACLPLIDAVGYEQAAWIAREIIAPLNGYAVLADSNFKPAVAVSVEWKNQGGSGAAIFSSTGPNRRPRLISTNRHPLMAELLPSRVEFMTENPLAAYAAAVIGGAPSWAEYYRLLEDIAGYRGTTLDKLAEAGLAKRQALNAFKAAANNRAFGRHGASKRDTNLPQEDFMNLLEAREFVRQVVSAWLDDECGSRMPHDRVDGGQLRFGLDDFED
jgi:hypothetical protein